MKLSEIKSILPTLQDVNFELENGAKVPEHFHITEIGMITKSFIDCGGRIRNEKYINFQLWNAQDTDHRLQPSKLLKIIAVSEVKLGIDDQEIEVEYQSDTIGKYGLKYSRGVFILTSKQTDCLAKDNCGISQETLNENPKDMSSSPSACCDPNSKCC